MKCATRWRPSAVALAMSIITACSAGDAFQPVLPAPDAVKELQTSSASADGTGSGPSASSAPYDTLSGYIMVGPGGGNWVFGEHKINFPPNSICDMAQTNYFDWGKACTPIASDVRIDLKWWRDAEGHPHVDFSPAMRFQPTKKGEVTLYLKDQAAAKALNPVIGYCVSAGAICIDESNLDNALVTKRDSRGGFVYRIIRHFSGYNVWA